MEYRTDLALEANELQEHSIDGTSLQQRKEGELTITSLRIDTRKASCLLEKPVGEYITIEGLRLTDSFRDGREAIEACASELKRLLPADGQVLVAGLGNSAITPDALGPESIKHVLATRHIGGELAKSSGLDRLRPVSVIAPGVLGQTGMEAGEILSSLVKSFHPCAVIVIDALAAKAPSRLGCTVQLSTGGIAPGSGVGNHRLPIDSRLLGVPVIAMGVPTVVDAAALALDLWERSGRRVESMPSLPEESRRMMVTPRETDIMIQRAARLTGMAVNCALQCAYDFDTLAELVA